MPIDPVKVALAQSRGLSAVCSTCTKYWNARDRGVEGDQCLAVDGCGSPLAGDCFHEYDGLIADFTKLCFVCGGKPKYGLRVGKLLRVIGVCEKHIQMVHNLKARGQPDLPVRMEGAPKPEPKKKLVSEAIKEVEDYYAKRDGIDPEEK